MPYGSEQEELYPLSGILFTCLLSGVMQALAKRC